MSGSQREGDGLLLIIEEQARVVEWAKEPGVREMLMDDARMARQQSEEAPLVFGPIQEDEANR